MHVSSVLCQLKLQEDTQTHSQLPLVPQVEVTKAWGLYMRMCMPEGSSVVSSSSPGSPMCRCAYMKPEEVEAMCSMLWTSGKDQECCY